MDVGDEIVVVGENGLDNTSSKPERGSFYFT